MASNAAIVKDVQQFQTALTALKAQAESIVVSDAATCLEAKTAQRNVRNYLKDVHSKLDPFVNLAKRTYDETKDERAKWILPGEEIDEALADKVKTYERQEREAAQREQDKINAENARLAREKADADAKAAKEKAELDRKKRVAEIQTMLKQGNIGKREAARLLKEAGAYAEAAKEQADADAEEKKKAPPPAVTVKPNIPAVAGVPSRVNYKAEVTNGDAIIQAFVDAAVLGNFHGHNDDAERANYLRQFIIADAQAIGAEARKVKDSKKMAGLIPGVRFYED